MRRAEHDPYIKISLEELQEKTECDSILIKRLIARLRRKLKKKPWQDDWELFKEVFEGHHEYWLSITNFRMLVSIMDTYVDHGNAAESKNALLVTSLAGWEKIVSARMKFVQPIELSDEEHRHNITNARGRCGYGFRDGGDMPLNLFKRMIRSTNDTPVIEASLKALMRLLLKFGVGNLQCREDKLAKFVPPTHIATPAHLKEIGYEKFIKQYEHVFRTSIDT